ncbi:MAG TPA: SDR family oxidoreductase [Polyangiaceae bacterium]|nr:SDR family oxidoreductase [Polyangiaceae bacterium]
MQDMKGKLAVITGGSTGIGLATAKALVQRSARVILFARDPKALAAAQAELGPAASTVSGDVCVAADLERLFAQAREQTSSIDALFVNAGVAEFVALERADLQHYERVMDTNVKGAFLTMKHALPLLGPGSSVVFNTSVAAAIGAPRCSVYGASKGAVTAFARNLAAELLPRGVRINMLAPGPTATPILEKAPVDATGQLEMAPFVAARMRMGRLGSVEEIAEAAAFLLSPRSSFIVAQELCADGGMVGI